MGQRLGRIAGLGTALAAGWVLMAAGGAAAAGPGIVMSTVTGTAGQQATVTTTLSTGGGQVAGTQNDFTFATASNRNVTVNRKANGKPNCTVNAAIDKGSTSFAFQPPSCTADTCTAVRAIVFSTDNSDPIPDGSVLFTCVVDVASGAPDNTYTLAVIGAILSNPTGGRVCGTGASDPPCTGNQDGSVTVGIVTPGMPTFTPTVTQTGNVSPSPTPAVTQTGNVSPSPTPTVTQTGNVSPSPTPTVSQTGNVSPSPTPTRTQTGNVSPSTTPTRTPTGPTSTPTRTGTGGPTSTPTRTATPTPTGSIPIRTPRLASAISATDSTIPVFNPDTLPPNGLIQIGSEKIRYFGIDQSTLPEFATLLNAERGVEGTVPQAHPAGAPITLLGQPTFDDDGCDSRVAGGSARTAWLVLIPVAALLFLRRRSK